MTDPAADRIAKAPRAWAVKVDGGPISVHAAYTSKIWADRESLLRPGTHVVQVALVELEEGE